MSKKMEVSTGESSTKGLKEENEDFCGVLIPERSLLATKGIVALVADGMSTCRNGREASELCGRGFLNDYFSTPETWSVQKSVEKVLASLNSWLYSNGQGKDISTRGLVTTLSILILKSTTAYICHVGDSRIYRIRNSHIEQVTRDHRILVSENNYLNRAIGIDLRLDIDYRTLPLQADDIFILTTDGVHDFISDNEIQELVNQNSANPGGAAEKIVSAALNAQSSDNLTCEIIHINSLPSQEAKEVTDQLTELPFPPELSVGMSLDNMRVLSEIHLSSRSQIYLCKENLSSRKIALKTPSVNFEDDPAYIERFLLEEWVGQRIDSPAVRKIYDRDKKFLYIASEYLEGRTLTAWITNNPDPDINEVLKITDDIVKGLRAFHRLEIIHQDLKPDNIIVEHSGNIKIIDFGSVRIAGIAEIATPFKRERLLGTKHYTAPEYLFGETGSMKSDMFSLGVIIYEMLTGGRHPYGEALVKLSNHLSLNKLEYIPSYHYNPMIPVWMDGAIKKAVMPDAAGRYEVLSAFLYDLNNPNPRFAGNKTLPFIKKNPLLFWKCIALLQLIILFILFFLVSKCKI